MTLIKKIFFALCVFLQVSAIFAYSAQTLKFDSSWSKEKDYPTSISFDGNGSKVSALCFDSKGKTLASATGGKIALWNAEKGILAGVISPDKDALLGKILRVAFFRDEADGEILIACGGAAGEFGRLAKIGLEGDVEILAEASDTFSCLDIKNGICAVGAYDGTVLLLDLKSGKKIFEKKYEGLRARSVSLSEDASVFALSLSDGIARIKRAEDNYASDAETLSLGSPNAVCALLPNGKYLAWGLAENGGKSSAYLMEIAGEDTRKMKCDLGGVVPADMLYDSLSHRFYIVPEFGIPVARHLKNFGATGRRALEEEQGKKDLGFPTTYKFEGDGFGLYSFAVGGGGNVFACGSDNGKIYFWRARNTGVSALFAVLKADCSEWGVSVSSGSATGNAPKKISWKTRDQTPFTDKMRERFFSEKRVANYLEESFNPALKAERARLEKLRKERAAKKRAEEASKKNKKAKKQ